MFILKEIKMGINEQYINLLKNIYYNGFEYEDPNRRGVIRKQINNATLSFNLANGFEVLTCKQVFPKTALNELKAFINGENTLEQLHKRGIKFWDKDGYNFYKRNKGYLNFDTFIKSVDNPIIKDKGDLGAIYGKQMRSFGIYQIDQITKLIKTLKKNPFATKKTVTLWNPSDLGERKVALTPCHWSFEVLVDINPKTNNKRLSLKWHQHSTDVFLGLPMNILYYWFLAIALAIHTGMEFGELIGDLSNVHLYDNSFDVVKKIINTPLEDFPKNPLLNISCEMNNDFYEMLESINFDFLEEYKFFKTEKVEMLAYNK